MKVCDAVSTRLNEGMLAGEAVTLAVQMLEVRCVIIMQRGIHCIGILCLVLFCRIAN